MEVEIVAKEVIKPSTPTTKTFHLSFLDQQLYGCVYIKMFFFYQNSSGAITADMASERAHCLKASASEVLSFYYPLAGKVKDKFTVSMGEDDGVEFIEARVNGTLSEYLADLNNDLNLLKLVTHDYWESWTRPLLIIQANSFTCGGLAIGINMSHRIADAATFSSFMNAWANTTIAKFNNDFARPDFSGYLTFPPSDKVTFRELKVDRARFQTKFLTKRFVFSASRIKDLKEKATKSGLRPPSRVQTVAAFLWRIGMKMSISKDGGSRKPSRLTMPINLRSILPPPICAQTLGNFIELFTVYNPSGDTEIDYLVTLIATKIEELRESYRNQVLLGEKNLNGCIGNTREIIQLAFTEGVCSNFVISSWFNFPFYNADFGWGKPKWVANCNGSPNSIVLMDTSDGTGIEVVASFSEEDMAIFESDEEFLAYATPRVHGLLC